MAREPLLAKARNTAGVLNQADDSEDYWELVKAQFTFVPGLYYFNNASLGPSPELVADATENFRRTLDGFPSKYMWGGWNTDKEQVREKAAQTVGASPEEIALIHNTTEGMNVIAASMDLEPGDEASVRASADDGTVTEFEAIVRLDTEVEVEYYRNGGILQTVLRQLV